MYDNEVNVELISQGLGSGTIAKRMLESNFSTNALRPFEYDGKIYINGPDGKAQRLYVNDATLLKDEWIRLDTAVMKAAQPNLKIVADLRAAGLTYNLGNGMGTTVLQTQSQSDITAARITMDGLTKDDADRPQYDLTSLPIPIITKDFSFSLREISASRNGSNPLDTTMAELAGRKVSETIERLVTGTYGTYAFGGGTIYGLGNFPNRGTHSITVDWAGSATTGAQMVADVISMIKLAKADYHYGPYMLYTSSNYSFPLEEDFKAAGDKTIRQRIKEIEGIQDVQTLEYLADNTIVLLEMQSSTIRLVEGLPQPIQVVQWASDGGMRLNFKVMAITVPQIRSDYNDRCGLVVGLHS